MTSFAYASKWEFIAGILATARSLRQRDGEIIGKRLRQGRAADPVFRPFSAL
jgi:hypothetical protein